MPRVCAVSGKKVLFGNKVSHSNRKTRTRFDANLQRISFPSEILGTGIRLRLTPRGIRTVEKHGGIDAFLLNSKTSSLSEELRIVKKRVAGAQAKKQKKAS
jgi:large subunit ribosomal protein L28